MSYLDLNSGLTDPSFLAETGMGSYLGAGSRIMDPSDLAAGGIGANRLVAYDVGFAGMGALPFMGGGGGSDSRKKYGGLLANAQKNLPEAQRAHATLSRDVETNARRVVSLADDALATIRSITMRTGELFSSTVNTARRDLEAFKDQAAQILGLAQPVIALTKDWVTENYQDKNVGHHWKEAGDHRGGVVDDHHVWQVTLLGAERLTAFNDELLRLLQQVQAVEAAATADLEAEVTDYERRKALEEEAAREQARSDALTDQAQTLEAERIRRQQELEERRFQAEIEAQQRAEAFELRRQEQEIALQEMRAAAEQRRIEADIAREEAAFQRELERELAQQQAEQARIQQELALEQMRAQAEVAALQPQQTYYAPQQQTYAPPVYGVPAAYTPNYAPQNVDPWGAGYVPTQPAAPPQASYGGTYAAVPDFGHAPTLQSFTPGAAGGFSPGSNELFGYSGGMGFVNAAQQHVRNVRENAEQAVRVEEVKKVSKQGGKAVGLLALFGVGLFAAEKLTGR